MPAYPIVALVIAAGLGAGAITFFALALILDLHPTDPDPES